MIYLVGFGMFLIGVLVLVLMCRQELRERRRHALEMRNLHAIRSSAPTMQAAPRHANLVAEDEDALMPVLTEMDATPTHVAHGDTSSIYPRVHAIEVPFKELTD